MPEIAIGDEISRFQERFNNLKSEVSKVLVGQEAMLEKLLLALLSGGHVLIEGVPGLAKTLTIQTLSDCIASTFSRIQFTPDMLPADITGTQIFNPKEGSYSIRKGPVFANLVLADEINRAPAKVQSALLEAMQEKQITIGDQSFVLDDLFLVLATQNPIEQEGTYPLPEAQLDRFMIKILITHPTKEEELKIIERMAGGASPAKLSKVMLPNEVLEAREAVHRIFVDDKVKKYVVDIVHATRHPEGANLSALSNLIEYGASPRASINLIRLAKSSALLQGRNYVTPHDIKSVAPDVLRHRVMLTYEAEAEERTPDSVIQTILDSVPVP